MIAGSGEIAKSCSVAQLEVTASARGARGGRWERSEGVKVTDPPMSNIFAAMAVLQRVGSIPPQ